MKIEIHILQNFAPSNLNRDDTGAPKDCEFGGVRRARVSSQCWKRAVREAFVEHRLFGEDTEDRLATRTKRLVEAASVIVAERGRKSSADAARHVAFALQAAKLKVVEENKTQYLLYLPRRSIEALAKLVLTHWDALVAAAMPPSEKANDTDPVETEPGTSTKKKRAKSKGEEKNAAKDVVPKDVTSEINALFKDVAKTPDLALFGRMITDTPKWNVDAACQVAHAISTHRVSPEFDFYTAVDDLRKGDTTGSDMMGTVSFSSACFYRYACLDVDALRSNLGGDDARDADAITRESVRAFLSAYALAIPSGKQNSMAAHSRPSYVMAVVREKGAPQAFANAFVRPVRPRDGGDLVGESVARLEAQLERGLTMWGDGKVQVVACEEVDREPPSGHRIRRKGSFNEWLDDVVAAATPVLE